ncbi:MAG: DUF4395 domain-containing protein [Candidatus Electrothrix sp. AW2]|nr:DUF4395 domain-containing protein [Candidatus Electrothrix sp. AX1]MCI5118159.1 DUF4395 domain-containing protein [Candidatus Electrothrix gigas]MCI5136163.1 DUF4395 domain-containing protein [Candidatus Electrothrix gigas]MCI5181497.1 DUF4395 domain-containing protein [Candidatus Electrothrix gigas]MCI5195430.1 DUF4395 domain-containing protein [Candidatus Electrothrix gigas]
MNLMCPVSFKKVNEHAVRINAALAFFSILLFFLTPWQWIILLVGGDFFIRGFLNPQYSLFAQISKKILTLLHAKPVMVDAGPKIFAAKIGFFFCCLLTAAWLFTLERTALIAGAMFMMCAALEAVFKFCVACQIYPFIYGLKKEKELQTDE